jgi:gliding motility-associated-like protein
MLAGSFIKSIIFSGCCLFPLMAIAQAGSCPPNIDFEKGNFNNWECRVGMVSSNPVNDIEWIGYVQRPGRHEIIASAGNTAVDEFGGFPVVCPNGSGYSVKLGNKAVNAEAEGLFYTYDIPANLTRFSLIINYAVVLQDPDHMINEQPRFRARIVNVTDGETNIDCVNFDFTASASLPGFQVSTTLFNVRYKEWTPISIDLTAYIGKKIRLEFITSDCTRGAHFGYAYIDVNSSCSGAIAGTVLCHGDPGISLTAPYGFQTYTWYADNSFSTVLSNSQTLSLNPAPPDGTSLPLIVTPYPGFGCVDTLYAEITNGVKPPSNAGPDKLVCSKQPSLIGAPGIAGMNYSWTPANKLNNAFIPDPSVIPGLTAPTEFIVKTLNPETGCYSYDSVTVTPFLIDTATTITGDTIYCPGASFNTVLSLNNPNGSLQWFQNSSLLNGATLPVYRPAPGQTSRFWAQIKLNGCIDSTRSFTIHIAAKPKSGFTVEGDLQCLNNPVEFINTSKIAGNSPLTYIWRFSDGLTAQDTNLVRNFTSLGNVVATLVAVSDIGCRDSIQKVISLVAECGAYVPNAFTPNNDGRNDVIKPFLTGQKAFKKFSIYNRFGNLIFTTSKNSTGWDGTYKGLPQNPAIYIWVLEYIDKNDRLITQKGTLALIR